MKKLFRLENVGYFLVMFWAVVGAIATASSPWAQSVERRTQSSFLKLRGSISPPENVVILAIDESSLSQGEFYDPQQRPFLEPLKSWPWKRAVYATVIDRLIAAGAKVVAIDVLFATPSIYGAEDDAKLQQALQRHAGRVVLAASYESADTIEASAVQLITPAQTFTIPAPMIGIVSLEKEANGNIHRFDNQLAAQTGIGAEFLSFAKATLSAARINYPIPKGNHIFFYGSGGTWLTAQQQIPFFHVLDPVNWHNQVLNGGKYFKNKIVLIGATANSLQDIQPSASGNMPGVEIHANAIATLISNRAIAAPIPQPLGTSLLVLTLVAIIGIRLIRINRPAMQFAIALGAAGVWGLIAYASFTYGGVILPTAMPIVAIVLSGISLLSTGAIATQFDKLMLRRTLERYVAAPVVKEIVNQPDDFRALLEGRNLKAAVLFSDIRGFTTMASKMPANKLISQLNTYLTVMVDAILEAQGTVDKFIGDAVMAEFGSPISQGEAKDAMNAIHAALKMRAAIADLRLQWQAAGQVPFFNGIGINYGEVTVGNIGSPRRLEYAVMGDTVNVASRVEGLTKELGTDILITEALYELVKDAVDVIDLGEHSVKGRVGQVRLYSLISLKGGDRTLYQQVQRDMNRHLGSSNQPPM